MSTYLMKQNKKHCSHIFELQFNGIKTIKKSFPVLLFTMQKSDWLNGVQLNC